MTEDIAPERPLVTFALFAYNQEKYIREAVEGAFSQTYQPLEIILSDDCSTDRTYQIMEEMAASYTGPHQVRPRRNAINLGVARHFCKVLDASSSDLIVLAAGDDISTPERSKNSVAALLQNLDLTFVEVNQVPFCDGDDITKLPLHLVGTKEDVIFHIDDYLGGRAPSLVGALRAFRISAIMQYGPLRDGCPTEDTPSLLRLLMLGHGAKLYGSSVYRRLHENNLSSVQSLLKMNFDEILNQYRDDISHAREHCIVSSQRADQLEIWAVKTIQKRITFLAHEKPFVPFLKYLSNLKMPKIKMLVEMCRYVSKRIRKAS